MGRRARSLFSDSPRPRRRYSAHLEDQAHQAYQQNEPSERRAHRGATASAGTPPSTCSRRPTTNSYDSLRWAVQSNRSNKEILTDSTLSFDPQFASSGSSSSRPAFGEQEVRAHARVETRPRSRAGIRPTTSWLVVSDTDNERACGTTAARLLAGFGCPAIAGWWRSRRDRLASRLCLSRYGLTISAAAVSGSMFAASAM